MCDIAADFFDRSGDLAAENDRRLQPKQFTQAVADFLIHRIDRRDVNFHQNFTRFRFRTFDINVIQNTLITVFVNLYCSHLFLLIVDLNHSSFPLLPLALERIDVLEGEKLSGVLSRLWGQVKPDNLPLRFDLSQS